jgi:subtilisin family serine protease
VYQKQMVTPRTRYYISLVVTLCLIAVAGSLFLFLQINVNTKPNNPRHIYLRSGTIDTTKKASLGANSVTASVFNWIFTFLGKDPKLSVSYKRTVKSFLLHLDGDHYHNNHVDGRLDDFEDALVGMGIQLGKYVPHNTYIVTGTHEQMDKAKEKFPSIILWYGEMNQKDKMHNIELIKGYLKKHIDVERLSEKKTKTGQRVLLSNDKGDDLHFVVVASVAEHETKESLSKRAEDWKQKMRNEHGLNVVSTVAASTSKIVVGVQGAQHALKTSEWLTSRGHVHWVEIKPPTITHNKYSGMLIQSYNKPYGHPLWDRGITGAGQIIGVGDTGCDYYHCFFYDDKQPTPPTTRLLRDTSTVTHRKFAAFWSYMDTIDSPGGHGTHVAGTASGTAHPTLSSPGLSDYNSPAYGGKLAFADCGCDTDSGCTCPDDTQCECDLKPNRLCQKRFGVVYLPLDLSDGYFPWFYSKGARVVSNSWGTGYYRDFSFGYSVSSAEIDKFSWDNKDFLSLFAAGNSGGQYGYASLTSESEAKNSLAIGASQNTIESFMDAANLTDYSQVINMIKVQLYQHYCVDALYGTSTDPNKAALCASAKDFATVADCCNDEGKCSVVDSKCCGSQKFNEAFPNIGFRCCPACIDLEIQNQPTHFQPNNLALFTARGPTLDGRIKPDVVTVGDKIMSSLSQGTNPANTCNRNMQTSKQLLRHEGTSMACPVAASAALLVRQYFVDGFYPSNKKTPSAGFNPSAALVKAMMIHSTKLLDGLIYLMSKHIWWPLQYKEGHRFQLRQAYHQGFGRIELNNVLGPNSGVYIPNVPSDAQITTGLQDGYCVHMRDGGTFKATLVWTDYPSTPNAQLNLVNDLDLIVVMPDGTRYFGNGRYSPVNSARDEADYLNNVEQFVMDNAPAGLYNVIIRGSSVPQGPQPYAIVISGANMVKSSNCFPFRANLTPELVTYSNYAYAFGITCLIAIPTLSLLSIYLYLQYRTVTTAPTGYRKSGMARTSRGDYLLSSEAVDLKTVKKNMPNREGGLFDEEGNIEGGDEDIFGNKIVDKRGGSAADKAHLIISDREQ